MIWREVEKKGAEGRRERKGDIGLTFFGVAWCILAGVADHPVEIPGSGLKHVIPG